MPYASDVRVAANADTYLCMSAIEFLSLSLRGRATEIIIL